MKKLHKRNLHAHDRKIYEKSNNQVIKLKPKWTYVIFPKILIMYRLLRWSGPNLYLSLEIDEAQARTDGSFVCTCVVKRQNILKGFEIATNFVSQNSARNYLYLSNVDFD